MMKLERMKWEEKYISGKKNRVKVKLMKKKRWKKNVGKIEISILRMVRWMVMRERLDKKWKILLKKSKEFKEMVKVVIKMKGYWIWMRLIEWLMVK
jgi:hypothetical protein